MTEYRSVSELYRSDFGMIEKETKGRGRRWFFAREEYGGRKRERERQSVGTNKPDLCQCGKRGKQTSGTVAWQDY